MKRKRSILTAVILSASIGLGAQSISAQMAGISSEDIKSAQEALKANGLNPGPIDGNMGSQTEQALRAFQQANNLPVTGVLDEQTAEKLGVKLSGQRGSIPQ